MTASSSSSIHLSVTEAKQRQCSLLPIGSYEQHGPHLPVTTDLVIAQAVAESAATVLPLRLLPALPFSCSHEHYAFGADISLRAGTLEQVIGDIVDSGNDAPPLPLVLFSWHGGNRALVNIVRYLNRRQVRVLLAPTDPDRAAMYEEASLETAFQDDFHGGELETSIMLHLAPETVDMSRAEDQIITNADINTYGFAQSPTGVFGAPTKATARKGQRAMEVISRLVIQRINEFTRETVHT